MTDTYLRFWGVRGSYAAPFKSHLGVGGNTSCVELHCGKHVLICDAGTGIIPLGEQLCASGDVRELMILLTHYHWDHICGLPFFQPAFHADWSIKFFGPGENRSDIERRLAAQMKAPYFPVETETWTATIDYLDPNLAGLEHGPFQVSFHNVHHPGVTYGYRVRVGGKTVVYVSDNEVLYLSRSLAQRYEEFTEEEQIHLDEIEHEERASELRFMAGADVLIHDSQYTPQQYAQKRGWGHSCFIDTVNCAIDAEVKELYLFHHDPSATDSDVDDILQRSLEVVRSRNAPLVCKVAREGQRIKLGDE
jgi:phosphoribosyl 1,2-cyclic phosphodiesterase